jgi:hypothetical protein
MNQVAAHTQNKTNASKSSWRREYIQLLSEGAKSGSGIVDTTELELMRELINGDYATGSVTKGPDGSVMAISWEGPTVKGRLFIEKLESDLKKEIWNYKFMMISLVLRHFQWEERKSIG